jgi:hypothetical protein
MALDCRATASSWSPGAKADEADSGAVTLIQRFGSAANLNLHLHCLVLDGVYRCGIDGEPAFVEVSAPSDQALQTVLHMIITRTLTSVVSACTPPCAAAPTSRQALEQLCRSITRPALANERVQCNAAGRWCRSSRPPGATAPRIW